MIELPSDALGRWDSADDGRPVRVTNADGVVLVRAEHNGDPRRLWLTLPDHQSIVMVLDADYHPILGRCDVFESIQGERLAMGSSFDWARPTTIPALDRPGALPRGAGTAILNLFAGHAHRVGLGPLRYRGPYPSEALWRSLMASFRPDPAPSLAHERFVANAQTRAIEGRSEEIDVDFYATPHQWRWPQPRVCVQRRADLIERVYIDGQAYDRGTVEPHRLRVEPDALVATITLGTQRWCDRLRLSPRGEPHDKIAPLPAASAALVGTPLPAPVVDVLGQVLVMQAPPLLQPAIRHRLESMTIAWGDPLDALVRCHGDRLELHAGLVGALPTDSATLLGVLVQLVEGPVRRAAVATLDTLWSSVMR